MKKIKYLFINIHKAIVDTFVSTKSNNDIIIDNIMDNVVKMIALEEYSKKICKSTSDIEKKQLYNHNMQQVKNDIILLLNKVEFFK